MKEIKVEQRIIRGLVAVQVTTEQELKDYLKEKESDYVVVGDMGRTLALRRDYPADYWLAIKGDYIVFETEDNKLTEIYAIQPPEQFAENYITDQQG